MASTIPSFSDARMDGTRPAAQTPSGGSRACMACRKIKMRCIASEDGNEKCQRCARKALECVFREHRRGRKPGTRIIRKDETTNAAPPMLEAEAPGSIPAPGSTDQSVPSSRDQSIHDSAEWETGALQPSGLLKHAVSQGRFSLHNILNATDHGPVPRRQSLAIPSDDPVKLGLVPLSVASSLFQSFMNNQNPFIDQLDPRLHTLDYVRQRSSFLTAAILAVSAKGTESMLYERLLDYAEDLLTTHFRKGQKSTETVQAVMILTYWKKPEDNRAWLSLGYAVRMGMELGWHRLHKYSPENIAKMRNEQDCLEARNIQRTWYILFVYDRSMSLQTGKPWMIERSDFIESIEAWSKDPLASQGDRLLGAFVTLRLLSSEVFKLLGPRTTADGDQIHRLDSFLTIIKDRIDEWEHKWSQWVFPETCHPFQIYFYGSHLRLQLFSLPLQAVLARKEAQIEFNLEALWTSYSSAIEMLRLLCRYPTFAHLAQDSVHVMTAYSAKFLVKLLLSTPASISSKIEAEVLETIQRAAQVMGQRVQSPAGTSCSMQGAFLTKLSSDYMYAEKRLSKVRYDTSQGHLTTAPWSPPTSGPSQRTEAITAMSSNMIGSMGHIPTPSASGTDSGTMNGSNGLFTDQADHNFSSLDAIFAPDMTWGAVFSNGTYNQHEGILLG